MKKGNVITISDVAEALGVSKTTVSRAISGKGRIGEATRQKVLAYIEEHDYKPNVIARGLAQSKTFNLCVVMPEAPVGYVAVAHHCLIVGGDVAAACEGYQEGKYDGVYCCILHL